MLQEAGDGAEIPAVVLQDVNCWHSCWQPESQLAESLRGHTSASHQLEKLVWNWPLVELSWTEFAPLSAELPNWDKDLGLAPDTDCAGVSELINWWGSHGDTEQNPSGFADAAVVCEAANIVQGTVGGQLLTELQSVDCQLKSKVELWNWCQLEVRKNYHLSPWKAKLLWHWTPKVKPLVKWANGGWLDGR